MAAVASGMASLSAGAARLFQGGDRAAVRHRDEPRLPAPHEVGDGSHLAALTGTDSDIGQVGYEMAVLVDRVGRVIDANARSHMTG